MSRPNYFGPSTWVPRLSRSYGTPRGLTYAEFRLWIHGVSMGNLVCGTGPATPVLCTRNPFLSMGGTTPWNSTAPRNRWLKSVPGLSLSKGCHRPQTLFVSHRAALRRLEQTLHLHPQRALPVRNARNPPESPTLLQASHATRKHEGGRRLHTGLGGQAAAMACSSTPAVDRSDTKVFQPR